MYMKTKELHLRQVQLCKYLIPLPLFCRGKCPVCYYVAYIVEDMFLFGTQGIYRAVVVIFGNSIVG